MIGLGAMGLPMARHLAATFGAVTVFDIAPSPAASQEPGLVPAGSVAAVAAASEVVVLCLPDRDASVMAIEGSQGLCAGARPGLVAVDCSTLESDLARRFGVSLAKAQAAYFDAPVFGTPRHAAERQLTVVLSGPESARHAASAAVSAFSRRVLYAGAAGTASLFKVAQNSLGLAQIAAIVEAFALVEAAGGDRRLFYQAVVGSGGMADSPLFEKIGSGIADHKASFGALLRIAIKDITLGRDLALKSKLHAPLLQATADLFEAADRQGRAGRDLLEIADAFRMRARERKEVR